MSRTRIDTNVSERLPRTWHSGIIRFITPTRANRRCGQKRERHRRLTAALMEIEIYTAVQRQTAVTGYFSSKQLLLFSFAPQYS